ncbi:SCO1664 family protein [Brevibacterium daeguense]|uniref:SCO1664 family protein n=1 Tax=Brevibacterium daeguense TaxID=909936 RepID=A0ABP8ENG1_9MICO|nr:SCO1664 family protein [Brevibacterium daeguense]
MLNEQDVCRLLQHGVVVELGRIPEASNDTRLVTVDQDGVTVRAVYKPLAGERPLRDFAHRSLGGREVASYLLSRRLGLDIVPPTVMRAGLPSGPGSLQAYVESADDAEPLLQLFAPAAVPANWSAIFNAVTGSDEEVVFAHALDERLRRQAFFDVVTNNADRKASHILFGHYLFDGRPPTLFGIDNGLTFHAAPKLRTVLWGFAGSALLESETVVLQKLLDDRTAVAAELGAVISDRESTALFDRAEAVLRSGSLPGLPLSRTPIPWPPL